MRRNLMGLAVAALVSIAFCAQAQKLDAVKQSMLDRKASVDRALAAKTVGENSAGLLQVIGNAADADKKVVEAENADRKVVYAAIAAKNGTDVALVGQHRAAAIAEKAKAGTMIQSKDGKWIEKK